MTERNRCFDVIKALGIRTFSEAERVLPAEVGVTLLTARVYFSEWRKLSGKARKRRTKEELGSNGTKTC